MMSMKYFGNLDGRDELLLCLIVALIPFVTLAGMIA